jgi:hypothetical protein
VDGAEICIVEKIDKESFGGFLQGHDGLALPSAGAVFGCDCLRDLSDLRVRQHGSRASWSWGRALTSRWKGSFRRSRSVVFWYRLISRRATVPGL